MTQLSFHWIQKKKPLINTNNTSWTKFQSHQEQKRFNKDSRKEAQIQRKFRRREIQSNFIIKKKKARLSILSDLLNIVNIVLCILASQSIKTTVDDQRDTNCKEKKSKYIYLQMI